MNLNRLEDYNIARDPRSKGPAPDTIVVYDPNVDGDTEIVIPTKWAVCSVCDGEGKHVNPAIDAGGLSEEMMDDPDFMDGYMSGVYDVPCNHCSGKRVVRVPDYDKLNDYERKLLDDHYEAEAAYEAERLAEIRMGC